MSLPFLTHIPTAVMLVGAIDQSQIHGANVAAPINLLVPSTDSWTANWNVPSRIAFTPVNEEALVEANFPGSVAADVQHIFSGLAERWRRETSGYSLTSQKYAHPAYQAIMKLGPDAVPLILKELQVRPGRWLAALKELAAFDPTRPGDNFDAARKAWLDWGREKGLIS